MEPWLESVYSDGTEFFVSTPEPELGQTVTVKLRLLEGSPVERVLLRSEHNGLERYEEMREACRERGLVCYEAPLTMTENRIRYRFLLVCPGALYHYNQLGVSDGIPDGNYDFALLADYRQPAWVKDAVFYQIFPERFANGNPENDVRDGELTVDGHPSIHMDWSEAPLPYEKGFCMDFFGGDLDGIREKIPYLKELGVTALYLNPIFTAPSVHKYNCIDYLEVDPHFGGDEALARLSEALHENGMRLVLDISINHTGAHHRWFNRDGLYFPKSEGACNNPDSVERGYYFFEPGGNDYKGWNHLPELPVLNYTSEALRKAIYLDEGSVLKKWLKPPYSIDGWRFDVADVFARNDEVQLAHTLWPEIRKSIREENPSAYILAEEWGDCAQYLQGDEWDAPMNYFGCSRIVREFFGGGDLFLGRVPALRDVKRTVTGRQLRRRVEMFLGKLPYVIAQNQFNLLDSHDVPRIAQMPHMTWEKTRGAVILMFTLLGCPNVYYGDEANIGGWTETVEGCRYPMPWNTGFESGEAYKLYHDLCGLKKPGGALTHGGMKFLYAGEHTLALARFTPEETLVAAVSADSEETEVEIPLSLIGAQGPTGDADLLGRSLRWTPYPGGIKLRLGPQESVLFSCSPKKDG